MRRLPSAYLLLALLALLTAPLAAPALAADDEVFETLGLSGGETVVATSKLPRPTSQIAENVTVITAAEIERLNAHTLAEVLNSIPGVQLQQNSNRTPGGDATDFFLQGASAAAGQVLVLIDGVHLNRYAQGWANVSLVPVQQIERVEVLKGAASATWGAALGGVVNVITKSPAQERLLGGEASASLGERTTTDTRGEFSGTTGSLGYYFSGGKLYSRGLLPNNDVDNNNGYFKLAYTLPSNGTVTFGGSIWEFGNGDEGAWSETIIAHDNYEGHYGYSFLTLTQPLAERLTLELTGMGRYGEDKGVWGDKNPDGSVTYWNFLFDRESSWGGGAKLSYGDSSFGATAGVDYEHGKLATNSGTDHYQFDRYGFYANGLLTAGRLTILPGIRHDITGISGDFTSYTLGGTFRLTEKTLLRGYGARGYGQPFLDANHFDKKNQKVWTVQAGVETTEIPYLWLKGTLFYNRLRDAYANESGNDTQSKQTKRGFEVEARTSPWQGLSLTGGYTYDDSRDADHERQKNEPWHIGKLGLLYDNTDLGLKGTVSGSYVWWNSDLYGAKYDTVIWDLHLSQRLPVSGPLAPELFFSVRNLFNGTQRISGMFDNAPRWVEGGVRIRF